MTVRCHPAGFHRLGPGDLQAWIGAEAAAVSDCLDRFGAMDGGISPLAPSMRILGQARTVRCMVGDNGPLHAALELARPGEVLVVDADGFKGRAVWGNLMTRAALHRELGGIVVDGAVRDSSEITELGFPCFSRWVTPAGPHKGFGGAIDGPISCGGQPVQSGDLIIGDADGVTVLPLSRLAEALPRFHALKEKEAQAIAALECGGSLQSFYGVPEIVDHEAAR